MVTTNVFALLKDYVDPTFEKISDEMPLIGGPLLDVLGYELIKGIKVPEAGIMEFWQPRSMPAIHIGDRWGYVQGGRTVDTGKIKFKKMTISVVLSEDELNRIEVDGQGSMIEKVLRRERKENVLYLRQELEKWCIDPWDAVTTSTDYDSLYAGLFKLSSTGTVTNPSDMNTTAGTAEDLSATVMLTGTSRTYNNVSRIAAQIQLDLKKIDFITKRETSFTNVYYMVNPLAKKIMDTNYDMLNATTQALSPLTYTQDLAKMGITVISSPHISYTYGSTNEMTGIAFADPNEWFEIYMVDNGSEGWSEWKEKPNENNGITTYSYEKHRKIEFGVHAGSTYINSSATAGAYLKPVCHIKIEPYTNT